MELEQQKTPKQHPLRQGGDRIMFQMRTTTWEQLSKPCMAPGDSTAKAGTPIDFSPFRPSDLSMALSGTRFSSLAAYLHPSAFPQEPLMSSTYLWCYNYYRYHLSNRWALGAVTASAALPRIASALTSTPSDGLWTNQITYHGGWIWIKNRLTELTHNNYSTRHYNII